MLCCVCDGHLRLLRGVASVIAILLEGDLGVLWQGDRTIGLYIGSSLKELKIFSRDVFGL